jgi:LmbE family N-acetylglucosaminyl deacetylase
MKNARLTPLRLVAALLLCATAQGEGLGAVALHQARLDLGSGLRLMCVAAHPDDEDGATLALHRMQYGVETHAVIATRGEGGQNEIGPELYEALAVIRTAEMRAAAAIEGAHLHFLDLPEFGFSKSPEETFGIWGKEETLARLVRVIRTVRPHVIITHHGRDKDHGHHQAIGQALQEAFDLAGDPRQFPAQLAEGLAVWQPLRLYIRNWTGGAESVSLDISALEPVRGMTYAEVAADALRAHHSQGMEFFIERLLNDFPMSHYDLVKEAPDTKAEARMDEAAGPLFKGLPLAVDSQRRALAAMDAPSLVTEVAKLREARSESGEGTALSRAANAVAAVDFSFRLDATAMDELVTPDQPVAVETGFSDYGEAEAQAVRVALVSPGADPGEDAYQPLPLDPRGHGEVTLTGTLPVGVRMTLPKAAQVFQPHYDAPQWEAVAQVTTASGVIELRTPVRVEVAAATQIAFAEPRYLVRTGALAKPQVVLSLTNTAADARNETVTFGVPAGWQVAPASVDVAFAVEDEQQWVTLQVTPPAGVAPGVYALTAGCAADSEPVSAAIHVADVATPEGARVAVVQSYDDTLVKTLAGLDVAHAILGPADFTPAKLDTFTSILVDMRAYAKRPDLVASNGALLDFARRGGTLVVFYQKTFEWSLDYAPYPLRISRNRVTREDAPITVLVPEHPLFTRPNRIVEADWAGWIQERGLYFADQFDDAYTPLIACVDPDEMIPPGGLLIAPLGEGAYVYTGLALYRQLRALHPGALRLFSNLVSLSLE